MSIDRSQVVEALKFVGAVVAFGFSVLVGREMFGLGIVQDMIGWSSIYWSLFEAIGYVGLVVCGLNVVLYGVLRGLKAFESYLDKKIQEAGA